MSRLNVIWSMLCHYKYVIVCVVGFLIVGVVDDNSFRKLIELELQIDDLNSEINKYNSQYKADTKELRELKQNPKAIERIARERYFMKADDEDIYVLSTDEKKSNERKNETTE